MNAVDRLHPALEVHGPVDIPGPCVITINHYTRPAFQAWWLALAISAVLSIEVHWVITSAWRYPDRLRNWTVTPVSRWILRGIAATYGFTLMPPMPPHLDDVEQRAAAVRNILRYARQSDCPMIGLAPEGGDFAPPGEVAELPTGIGRLMLRLSEMGLAVLPVGAFEVEGRLCLRFGPAYRLESPPGLSAADRDALCRQIVRQKIKELLG